MKWSQKIFLTALIFGLGLISGFVFSTVEDPFQRYVIPLISAMAALWIFDVFWERALRAMRRSGKK